MNSVINHLAAGGMSFARGGGSSVLIPVQGCLTLSWTPYRQMSRLFSTILHLSRDLLLQMKIFVVVSVLNAGLKRTNLSPFV